MPNGNYQPPPPIPLDARSHPPDSLDDAPTLTLVEAAAKVDMAPSTLRTAIRRGELEAFLPRGKHPGRTGPGKGYRIRIAELERWFLGGKP
jgi:hypothetical protein